MPGRVFIHLNIQVQPDRRDEFNAFLRDAVPFYQAPGDITITLLQNDADPSRLIEIVEYQSEEIYQRDQRRVESDPEMRRLLSIWRSLLDGPPEVVVYREQETIAAAAPTPLPSVQTAQVLLRPFTLEDAPEVARLAGDRAVAATTLLIPHPYELHHATQWIATHQAGFAAGQNLNLAVCDPSHPGIVLGAIGLTFAPAHRRAELGYWIGVPHWNRGYASRAAKALIDWAFTSTDLLRIHAYHYEQNPASGRVLVKAGMKPEGVARDNIIKWGKPQNCLLYAILRDDWTVSRA